MPTLNSQQGMPEVPGYQPGAFEVAHPEHREGQENKEGQARVNREVPAQEARPDVGDTETVRQKIRQHAESIKPGNEAENTQDDPELNLLLADILNGKKAVEELVLEVKTGRQARQTMNYLMNSK